MIDRLATLKEELEDMSMIIKEDIVNDKKQDEDIILINQKIWL